MKKNTIKTEIGLNKKYNQPVSLRDTNTYLIDGKVIRNISYDHKLLSDFIRDTFNHTRCEADVLAKEYLKTKK